MIPVLLIILIPQAYATHISQPILTMNNATYYLGSTINIEGFIEYQGNPTSNVLLEIFLIKDGYEQKIRTIRSDANGFFKTSFVAEEVGMHTFKIVSQCRDEHRNICAYRETSITLEVKDAVIARDDRVELRLLSIVKKPAVVEILISNISNEDLVIKATNFYIIDKEQIYLTNSNDVLTLAKGENGLLKLSFPDNDYDDPLIVYDDGISIIKIPEFNAIMIILIVATTVSVFIARYKINKITYEYT